MIDLEIDKIDNEIKQEQIALDKRISALAEKETHISEIIERITKLEKDRRTLEDEMGDKIAHVRDRQSKMMQVQTGREQTALLKEIEDAKKNAKENEDKIVEIMMELEKLIAQVEEEKILLKGEKELVAEETEKVRDVIENINKGKKTKGTKRLKQIKDIQENLLRKYDTLRERRKGLAVVNVVQGVCQGCFMSIPPQQYNLLLKGDKIFECPTCQRIIYHLPVEETEQV
jgi:uncharacterized protein